MNYDAYLQARQIGMHCISEKISDTSTHISLSQALELPVDGSKVPNLGCQLLHKYIKCEHQHSGRGLLLTISMSVGEYLYAGKLREKTHFMSRETHSSVQGKMRNYIQGSNGPLNSLT